MPEPLRGGVARGRIDVAARAAPHEAGAREQRHDHDRDADELRR